jgi:uncharacterized protein (DUF1697 family)
VTVVITMLRGVNVGGHKTIKMESLRGLCESLGFLDAQTYVQSGNVVFRTKGRDLSTVTRRIENGIERGFGFRPSVIARTLAELRDLIARNPFAARPGIDPSKLLVTFLSAEPDAEAREKVLGMKVEPEELRIDGRELYTYFPNGMARPKVPMALIEKTLRTPATGRNWNTVRKLLEMAEKLEGDVG